MPAREYEILYIVRPELDDEQLAEAQKSVDAILSDLGGQVKKTDVWGRRKLAYEVKHLREGHYVLTDFDIEPERVPELEATLRIHETVFRHLVTRKPERHVRGKPRQGEGPAQKTTAAEAAEVAPEGSEAAEAAPEAAEAEGTSAPVEEVTQSAESAGAEAEGDAVPAQAVADGAEDQSESESPPGEET
ncbi:MAG: 30S ribosomal protein S6 [bacterium]|jgi:small subunit ribosomal protein S6|nr:30S ribosomal protein S6 [bacterium]